LVEAKNGTKKVFFMDAAHFVHGSFLCFIYSLCRMFIPTPSGRSRFNVLGAIDAVTRSLTVICNDTYVNALTVCELLKKLEFENPLIKLAVILDNARYQHCAVVEEYAKSLKIDLVFLPAYSPHLNLIERLWKWIKKDCLYGKYYAKFNGFKEAINKSVEKVNLPESKESIISLLSWKFQTFNKTQIRTV
jgi:transposase